MHFAKGAALTPALSRGEREKSRQVITTSVIAFGVMTLVLALRALSGDPSSPTWTVAGLGAVSLLCVGLSLWTGWAAWWYGAGALLNGAATVWWVTRGHRWSATPAVELVTVNAIAAALSGLAALVLETFVFRALRGVTEHRGIPPYHRPVAALTTIAVLGVAALSWVMALAGAPRLPGAGMTWAALASAAALMAACLWDGGTRFAVGGLYLLGLAALGQGLAQLNVDVPRLLSVELAVAGYGVGVAYLYSVRVSLTRAAEGMGVPVRATWPAERPGWVGLAVLAHAGVCFFLAFGLVTQLDERVMRLAAGVGVVAATVAVGVMALGREKSRWHAATLMLAAGAAALWGWAWLTPGGEGLLLNRLVVLLTTAAAATVVYAVGIGKLLRRESAWVEAARDVSGFTGVATLALLVLTLGIEAMLFRVPERGVSIFGVPMGVPAMVAVGLSLVGLVVAALVCALVPGRDPFGLSERGRTAYVYGAEILLALLFLHVKLCVPDLLQIGVWRRYWPVIIVGVAFVGVGLSEVFRRQGRRVLAEPLERTGTILPILPAAAFFIAGGSHLSFVGYQHVLLTAALLYGMLAYLRKSFAFGIVSALAANGALWWVLGSTPGLGLMQHPQLWLIPAAVSVLVAAHLNQDRLGAEQMRTIRYVTMSVVYASSTADILLNGVGREPYLPIVLAALAVAGVLAGIAMRVRSFLFLGTVFLLVAIAAMIQYAALRLGSWPWMVAGLVLGVCLVVGFALMEKKREEMRAVVAGLRGWAE